MLAQDFGACGSCGSGCGCGRGFAAGVELLIEEPTIIERKRDTMPVVPKDTSSNLLALLALGLGALVVFKSL